MRYQVMPIPAAELHRIRAAKVDDFGNPVEARVNDDPHSAPLRCCLRLAEVGERIALIAYRPFSAPGPYAEVGPVFIHADACEGYAEPDRFPRGLAHRRLVLRGYDREGRIASAEFVDGTAAEAAIEAELARPEIAFLHFRAEKYGCFQFAVERC
jgi:hypothetical protein